MLAFNIPKSFKCAPTILLHERWKYRLDSTLSRFSIVNTQIKGFSLEDTRRENGVKVHGRTCIHAGVYYTNVNMSTRFKRFMTYLENTENFVGVRHHGGNHHDDSLGCLLTASNITNYGKDPKVPFGIQGSLERVIMEHLKTKVHGGWDSKLSDAENWAKLDNVWTVVQDAPNWRELQALSQQMNGAAA